jgi:ribosomal protein S1
LSDANWEIVKRQYPVGCEIEGVVENIQMYGVWVKYEFPYKGLMLIPDSGIDRGQMLDEVFSVGDPVRAKVIHHNDERKQLVLSRRA